MNILIVPLITVILIIVGMIMRSRFSLQAHERLVVFRLGHPNDIRGPGIVWILPILESGVKLNTDDSFEAKRIADYKRQLKQDPTAELTRASQLDFKFEPDDEQDSPA